MSNSESRPEESLTLAATRNLQTMLTGLLDALAGLALLLRRWQLLWEQLIEHHPPGDPRLAPKVSPFTLILGGRG